MGKKAKKANITVDAAIPKDIDSNDQENAKNFEINKKKKKKHKLLNDQDQKKEVDIGNICDASDVPKKRKKKNKNKKSIQEENTQDKSTKMEELNLKIRKKKIKDSISHGSKKIEETVGDNFDEIKEETIKVKKNKTKSHKKKKSKSDVLNEEDSQVTEEDIDRFCEELNEEDNKQYEDWVQLLEASLPPCRTK